MKKKLCTYCNLEKFVYDFSPTKQYKDGLTYNCKDCRSSLIRVKNYQKKMYMGSIGWKKRKISKVESNNL